MTGSGVNSLPSPTPFAGFEQTLVALRAALISGELADLNRANEALRLSVQSLQAQISVRPGKTAGARLQTEYVAVQRELRIAGELLARSSAANRRALSVYSDQPVSYGRDGL